MGRADHPGQVPEIQDPAQRSLVKKLTRPDIPHERRLFAPVSPDPDQKTLVIKKRGKIQLPVGAFPEFIFCRNGPINRIQNIEHMISAEDSHVVLHRDPASVAKGTADHAFESDRNSSACRAVVCRGLVMNALFYVIVRTPAERQDFLPSDIIAGIIIDLLSEQHPSIRSKAGQPSLIFQNLQDFSVFHTEDHYFYFRVFTFFIDESVADSKPVIRAQHEHLALIPAPPQFCSGIHLIEHIIPVCARLTIRFPVTIYENELPVPCQQCSFIYRCG